MGAGSAGCALANKLVKEGGHSVLMLEAGGEWNKNEYLHNKLSKCELEITLVSKVQFNHLSKATGRQSLEGKLIMT